MLIKNRSKSSGLWEILSKGSLPSCLQPALPLLCSEPLRPSGQCLETVFCRALIPIAHMGPHSAFSAMGRQISPAALPKAQLWQKQRGSLPPAIPSSSSRVWEGGVPGSQILNSTLLLIQPLKVVHSMRWPQRPFLSASLTLEILYS